MPRKARKMKSKKLGIDSFLKWHANEFSMFQSSANPWKLVDAVAFYYQNREQVHEIARENGTENNLNDWVKYNISA